MSESKISEPRVIKKYPNRRLYDTVESRYITLVDVRRLVMDKVDFVVIDKKTQEDITRSILLQVIAEQEHTADPLMSQDFLSQCIRSYGGTMQSVVGSYLDQSMKLFLSQQQQMRDRIKTSPVLDPLSAVANLTQQNYARWRSIQEDILRSFTGTARPAEEESEPATDAKRDPGSSS
jgi:polyhydroxyalkanoate synthesis repressor PhaR